MAGILKIAVEGKKEYFYFAFRVIVGLLFMQHGLQKLFGLLGGQTVDYFSLMGLAGVIEFSGGLLIALGLLTRLISLIAGLEMLSAYFIAHIGVGLAPIVNKGELALLFLACFLVILSQGPGIWSLDSVLLKRKER